MVKMSPQEFATNTNLERKLIEEATSAEDAIRLVKNSEIKQNEMNGFEIDRIRNIKTYIDVITDPDFSYREGNKIIYGKKYDDIKNANGFTSVVLDFTDNIISPIHSGFEAFNKARLENKDIKWYVNMESFTSHDDDRTTEIITSWGKLSDRFDINIKDKNDLSSAESEKNQEKIAIFFEKW